MVTGKVKAAMGFQKSPATSKPETPKHRCSPSTQKAASASQKAPVKAIFSRSFGVYFPRSTQVQPRLPEVVELVHLVEELQERESQLKTKLLEQKLLKENAAIVPFLEKEISSKNAEIDCFRQRIESLEGENELLKKEVASLKEKMESDWKENEKKMKEMEEEISELRNRAGSKASSEGGEMDECSSSQRFQRLMDVSAPSNLMKSLKKGIKLADIAVNHENQKADVADLKGEDVETERLQQSRCNGEMLENRLSSLKSRGPRVPKPPPRPSFSSSTSSSSSSSSTTTCDEVDAVTKQEPSLERTNSAPLPPVPPALPPAKAVVPAGGPPRPPPPPPPPAKKSHAAAAKVRRVPEVVEFYHSLMRRDSKRESIGGAYDIPTAANAKNMIGEIENRSAHLLAIKTDVETQGDFIHFLIKEVQNAAFTDIEDVVAFVKWLDDELSYLVDERAVLKHFDWPEHKADALREAAFGYCDLKKLEIEASSFPDDLRQPCGPALKKIRALLEKLEHAVYNISRLREGAMKRYKDFHIPWQWMLETGIVSQIKLASVKLAMKYMKRVSAELEAAVGGPEEEELMLQGVRFAFRVHQFAGGFDVETMRAFQELRDKAGSCHMQSQNQHRQKLYSRSTSC